MFTKRLHHSINQKPEEVFILSVEFGVLKVYVNGISMV